MSTTRTLWEEGRRPGRLVANASVALALVVVVLDLVITGGINLLFDAGFVALCIGAALWVRPRDFFTIGVLPPLLMAGTVLGLALFARDRIAEPSDGLVQALVSGLAHHAGALIAGYVATLVVLAIRRAVLEKRRQQRISVPRQRPAAASSAARMSRRSSGGRAKISDSSAAWTARASGNPRSARNASTPSTRSSGTEAPEVTLTEDTPFSQDSSISEASSTR